MVFEMIVLVGGMCVMGINFGGIKYGVFMDCEGVLINDFFVNLMDMGYVWQFVGNNVYELCDCVIGEFMWMVSWVDFVFGFSFILCFYVEVYVQDDNKEKFVNDFVKVWVKVMNVDCFDLN